MDLWSENNPEACSSVGLDCGTCIHQAAAKMARICPGIASAQLPSVFVQLYPSPACHPMAEAFAFAYAEAADEQPRVFTLATAAA
jgi:hypothetical protein